MPWNLIQKAAFRFFAAYAFLYCMSNQFVLTFAIDPVWQKVVPWFARHVIQLEKEITVFTNGSGDTTYNYVSLLLYVVLSAIAAVIWSVSDRKRHNYGKAFQWLEILIRYYLIYQMVIYGLAKIFYLQFQPPYFARLIQPYGDSSPMGLLWTFMGFSKGYTIFAGAGEFLGGLLLLFRRTKTLGALIVFGVMANVMALNYFYDVPVKILSTHLVLMALFLIALDGKRLWNVLVANKPADAVEIVPLFHNPKAEKAKNVLKWLVVTGWLAFSVYSTMDMLKTWGPFAEKPLLHGLYEVESFHKNGIELPPMATDSVRWKWLVVEWKDRATVQTMDGQKRAYDFFPDSTNQLVMVNISSDTTSRDALYYSYPDSIHLLLEGIHQKDTLIVLMRSKKKKDFLLNQREFRWVNEYPFNR